MSKLIYKEDFDEARDRLTMWWQGGDIGRPAMQLTAPRAEPVEDIPVMPEPAGWLTDYSTKNFDYRVNLAFRACVNTLLSGGSNTQCFSGPGAQLPCSLPGLSGSGPARNCMVRTVHGQSGRRDF